MSPHTRIALTKYRRELEEAWLDLEALDNQTTAFLERALAEREAARKSLRDKLRPIFASLTEAA